jgi:hypothetical protein
MPWGHRTGPRSVILYLTWRTFWRAATLAVDGENSGRIDVEKEGYRITRFSRDVADGFHSRIRIGQWILEKTQNVDTRDPEGGGGFCQV